MKQLLYLLAGLVFSSATFTNAESMNTEFKVLSITSRLAQVLQEDESILFLRIKKAEADKEVRLAYFVYGLKDQLQSEWDSKVNERIKRTMKRSNLIIPKLLENPERLHAVIEACDGNIHFHDYISDILKLSDEDYILSFTCYTGAYQGGGVFFLFSDENGLSSEPLRLKELNVHTSIHRDSIKEVEANSESGILPGYYNFDEDSKELFITFRSGGQWNSYSTTRHTFKGHQPILQEYIFGSQSINYPDPPDRPFKTERYVRGQNGWFLAETKSCSRPVMANRQAFDDC